MEGPTQTGEEGSAQRFDARVALFRRLHRSTAIHHFWWLVHNCVAHPMIGLAPVKPSFRFHDWTSRKINPSRPAAPSAQRATGEEDSNG